MKTNQIFIDGQLICQAVNDYWADEIYTAVNWWLEFESSINKLGYAKALSKLGHARILKEIELCQGNQSLAAKRLNMPRTTLALAVGRVKKLKLTKLVD